MAADTDPQLVDAVLAAADADPELSGDATYLVVAALEGEQAFADELGGTRPARVPNADRPAIEPVEAYLTEITVAGFRGIGPERTLSLSPAPGLTVVAGRNGSGKSSFAEALEVALTGDSSRRAIRATEWAGNWTNVHADRPRSIRVGISTATGPVQIGVDWPETTTKFQDMHVWLQRPTRQREPGLAGLGWERALDLCSPLLPHEELGKLLTAPRSQLYDSLEKILGLGRFSAAVSLLDTAHRDASGPERHRRAAMTPLKKLLAESPDQRAAEAHTQLRKQRPDRSRLRALAIGTAELPSGPLGALRSLAELEVPDPALWHAAAERLRAAAGQAPEDDDFDRMDRRAELRVQALALHERHGDQQCPVCGKGTLDSRWHTMIANHAARGGLDEFRRRRGQVRERRSDAERLVGALRMPSPVPEIELTAMAPAVAAVTKAQIQHAGHHEFAHHLDAVIDDLTTALTALRDEAAAEQARRQDAWTPLAEELAKYLALANLADAAAPRLALVTKARTWLLANVERLRNERFAPFAAQTQAIWDTLRQESNVDITGIHLPNPRGNLRAVDFATTVDGTATSGMSVLSTGELHAITLALFLPRATRPDSPFRFVVLDDPIQAMDPSKIDGFVQVLHGIAAERQVIVFSHDDRLPEAVRRLAPDATIVEVRRGGGSVVDVDASEDPAARNLADARALIRDAGVPPDLLRQVVPRLCRAAFEAVTRDAWYRRAWTAGIDRAERERRWAAVRKNPARLALALHADADQDVQRWLGRAPSRQRAMAVCGTQAHTGLTGPPGNAVEDVAELVDAVRRAR